MLFTLYGLQLDIPKEYKIQIWKGFRFYEGTVEISDFQNNVIRMDWNDLDKIIGKYKTPTEFFKEHLDKVRCDKDVVEFKLEQFPWDEKKDHTYEFHKLSYTTARKFPKKEIHDFLIGFGVFCHVTNRFIIIQYRPPGQKSDFEETALSIIRSFRCRCEEP